MYQPLIWKTHKRREEFKECPHCGKPLRWIYDGEVWHPCDEEPVMFTLHPDGKGRVMYKRELYENCLIYKRGDARFDGVRIFMGNVPHFYTCEVLKRHRQDYARALGGMQ